MKNKIIATVFLFFIIFFRTYAQTSGMKAENLGLVAELTYIKLTSENYTLRLINNHTHSEIIFPSLKSLSNNNLPFASQPFSIPSFSLFL